MAHGGLQFVAFFIVTSMIYGYQPPVGASPDALVAFYNGDRMRILIAAAFSGLNLLNLLWFAAALRTTLSDAGQDGWGAAATASSTAFGALSLLHISVGAALAYSIAGSGNHALTSGLNDFSWALVVLSFVPAGDADHVRGVRALAGGADLERALYGGRRSGRARSAGRHHLAQADFWAPDGAYSRFISPLLLLLWVLVVSRVLLTRSPATRTAW